MGFLGVKMQASSLQSVEDPLTWLPRAAGCWWEASTPLHRLLEHPHSVVAGFPQSEWSKRGRARRRLASQDPPYRRYPSLPHLRLVRRGGRLGPTEGEENQAPHLKGGGPRTCSHMWVPQKVQHRLTLQPRYPHLCVHPEELKAGSQILVSPCVHGCPSHRIVRWRQPKFEPKLNR